MNRRKFRGLYARITILLAMGLCAYSLTACNKKGEEGSAENSGEAQSAVTGVSGAGAVQTSGENGEAGNTSAAAFSTEAGVGETASGGATHTFSKSECEELARTLNDESHYGFLHSVYEQPENIDASEVLYIGAGLGEYVRDDEEKAAYRLAVASDDEKNNDAKSGTKDSVKGSAKSGNSGSGASADSEEEVREDVIPENTDGLQLEDGDVLIRVPREKLEAFAIEKTGVEYKNLSNKPEWVYLGAYDAYYLVLSEEETNLSTIKVDDAVQKDGVITVHYEAKELELPTDAYHVPVYEANLKVTENGYQFLANRLWVQKDILAKCAYNVAMEPQGDVILCAYEPDTDLAPGADVTFAILKDGAVKDVLPGVAVDNIREGYRFKALEYVGAEDFDGDGYTDVFAVCRYSGSADKDEGSIREDGRELRYYKGQENGEFVYDAMLSADVNVNVKEFNYSNVVAYLRTGEEDSAMTATYDSWREALKARVASRDESQYEGFVLIYLDDDRIPELVEVGKTEVQGTTVVSYNGGKLVESRIGRSFSYLPRLNLLCSTSGVPGMNVDSVYNMAGGSLELVQSGTYGYLDASAYEHERVGNLEYTYEWQGADVSKEGYEAALSFIYDSRSAVTVDPDSLMSAEEVLKSLE